MNELFGRRILMNFQYSPKKVYWKRLIKGCFNLKLTSHDLKRNSVEQDTVPHTGVCTRMCMHYTYGVYQYQEVFLCKCYLFCIPKGLVYAMRLNSDLIPMTYPWPFLNARSGSRKTKGGGERRGMGGEEGMGTRVKMKYSHARHFKAPKYAI